MFAYSLRMVIAKLNKFGRRFLTLNILIDCHLRFCMIMLSDRTYVLASSYDILPKLLLVVLKLCSFEITLDDLNLLTSFTPQKGHS